MPTHTSARAVQTLRRTPPQLGSDLRPLLERMRLEGRRTQHVPRSTLFEQGDEATTLLYIESGHVSTSVMSTCGREAVVGLLTAGDFVGESCLAGYLPRLNTARTISRSSILTIDRRWMIEALRTEPVLMAHFISHVVARKARVEQDMADQLFDGCEKRLARVLWLLSAPQTPDSDVRELPQVSQQVLADMVGTTRSHVNRYMTKFRRLGLIDYAERVRIGQRFESFFLS
jgi:CRP/FNR family cyclic AMP-dependent transcriptional regulator